MDDALGDLVSREWAVLMAEHRLRSIHEDDWRVSLRSDLLAITIVHDRGELSVSAFLPTGSAAEGWLYEGMVGKASEARLLQIAAERLVEDPRLLRGDPGFFEEVAFERRRLSKEWTAYYSREGPRPRTGHLP